MDKKTAQKIFMLQLEENAVQQKKWDLKKELGYVLWDEAVAQAMVVMMDESK